MQSALDKPRISSIRARSLAEVGSIGMSFRHGVVT